VSVPLLWLNIGMRAASCASRFVAKSFASAFQPECHENGHRCAYVSSRYMRRIWQYVSNAAL
jgi:hypothetical protein